MRGPHKARGKRRFGTEHADTDKKLSYFALAAGGLWPEVSCENSAGSLLGVMGRHTADDVGKAPKTGEKVLPSSNSGERHSAKP